MLDHMTMPVLFAVLIGLLAVVAMGVYLTLRIVGERAKASDETPDEGTGGEKLVARSQRGR